MLKKLGRRSLARLVLVENAEVVLRGTDVYDVGDVAIGSVDPNGGEYRVE